MKKITVLILLIVVAGGIGCKVITKLSQTRAMQSEPGGRRMGSFANVAMVRVQPAEFQPIREVLRLVGSIASETEISIQPRINGRLLSLNIEEGQYVAKGAVIGEIDAEMLQIQLQQSTASMTQIRANIQQAEINAGKLKLERDRYKELLAKQYISQSTYDNIEASYQSALASLEGVKAQYSSAEKNHELLKLQLRHTRITSPISGYILKKMTEPGVNLTTGSTVAVVVPLDNVRLVFSVDQAQAGKIRKGMPVTFSPENSGSRIFRGTIISSSPAYDEETRTLAMTARMPNPDRYLLPGMFGNIEILLGSKEKALVVNQDVVVQQEDKFGVFVVDSSGTARFRPVLTGFASDGKVEIVSGLNPDERVIVVGQNRVKDGQSVEILQDIGENGGPGIKGPSRQEKPGGESGRRTGSGGRALKNGNKGGATRPAAGETGHKNDLPPEKRRGGDPV